MAERSSKRSSSAPASRKESSTTESADAMNTVDLSPGDVPECAVCLQSCIHPVKLPCSHIFCFLCVKGAANQSRRCALCRQGIPMEYFNNPTLISKEDVCAIKLDLETEYYSWFYEGRNGWWQYDERTNVELEESYNAKKRTFELLIAGYMYVIDLDNMLQMRRNDPSRRRRIKRDLVSAPKKGIAGLKINAHPEDSAATAEDEQIAVPVEAAAGGTPPQQSETAPKAVLASGTGQTKSRTAGVGRDHANGNLSNVPVDQYDADDDYDGTDDDDNDVQWLGLCHGVGQAPRSRPERRNGSSHSGRPTRDNRSDLEAAAQTSTRQHATSHPQVLPIRHQRVSSAPETRAGRYDPTPVTRTGRPDDHGVDSTGVESAMHSLHLSTPDGSVYEMTMSPVQPPQGGVRQRRRRQRQNEDVEL